MPTKYGFPNYRERHPEIIPQPTPEDLIRQALDPYLTRTIGMVRDIVTDYMLNSLGLLVDASWVHWSWDYSLGVFILIWPDVAVISMQVTTRGGKYAGAVLLYLDLQENDGYLMAKAITDVTPLGKEDFELIPLSQWVG